MRAKTFAAAAVLLNLGLGIAGAPAWAIISPTPLPSVSLSTALPTPSTTPSPDPTTPPPSPDPTTPPPSPDPTTPPPSPEPTTPPPSPEPTTPPPSPEPTTPPPSPEPTPTPTPAPAPTPCPELTGFTVTQGTNGECVYTALPGQNPRGGGIDQNGFNGDGQGGRTVGDGPLIGRPPTPPGPAPLVFVRAPVAPAAVAPVVTAPRPPAAVIPAAITSAFDASLLTEPLPLPPASLAVAAAPEDLVPATRGRNPLVTSLDPNDFGSQAPSPAVYMLIVIGVAGVAVWVVAGVLVFKALQRVYGLGDGRLGPAAA